MHAHLTTTSYIATLEARLAELETHPTFGVARRPVLERRWATVDHRATALIFFDVDGLNALNARIGYAGADARIAAALAAFGATRGDTYLLQGGDEFAVLCPLTDAPGLVARMQRALWSQGLSASFAIVADAGTLSLAIATAADRLKAAGRGRRGRGRRGLVVAADGTVTAACRSRWGAFWKRGA